MVGRFADCCHAHSRRSERPNHGGNSGHQSDAKQKCPHGDKRGTKVNSQRSNDGDKNNSHRFVKRDKIEIAPILEDGAKFFCLAEPCRESKRPKPSRRRARQRERISTTTGLPKLAARLMRASLRRGFQHQERAMTRRVWDRPRYRAAGKSTESVKGGLPCEFFGPGGPPLGRKAEQRLEAEKALREWTAKNSAKPVSIIPEDEPQSLSWQADDDDLPF